MINRQQAPNTRIAEIVLVNGQTDRALPMSLFPPSLPILETTLGDRAYTPGRALNAGIRLTTGDLVAFLSGHSVPATNSWLHALCSPFSDPSVGGVSGPHIPWAESNWLERLYRNVWYNSVALARLFHHFNLANGAIRRSLWQHRPFNEELEGCEDRFWARHFRTRHAARFVFCKQAAVLHSHVSSVHATLRYLLWLWSAAIRSRFRKVDPC